MAAIAPIAAIGMVLATGDARADLFPGQAFYEDEGTTPAGVALCGASTGLIVANNAGVRQTAAGTTFYLDSTSPYTGSGTLPGGQPMQYNNATWQTFGFKQTVSPEKDYPGTYYGITTEELLSASSRVFSENTGSDGKGTGGGVTILSQDNVLRTLLLSGAYGGYHTGLTAATSYDENDHTMFDGTQPNYGGGCSGTGPDSNGVYDGHTVVTGQGATWNGMNFAGWHISTGPFYDLTVPSLDGSGAMQLRGHFAVADAWAGVQPKSNPAAYLSFPNVALLGVNANNYDGTVSYQTEAYPYIFGADPNRVHAPPTAAMMAQAEADYAAYNVDQIPSILVNYPDMTSVGLLNTPQYNVLTQWMLYGTGTAFCDPARIAADPMLAVAPLALNGIYCGTSNVAPPAYDNFYAPAATPTNAPASSDPATTTTTTAPAATAPTDGTQTTAAPSATPFSLTISPQTGTLTDAHAGNRNLSVKAGRQAGPAALAPLDPGSDITSAAPGD